MIKTRPYYILNIFVPIFLISCASTAQTQKQNSINNTIRDEKSAMQSIVGAIGGQDVNENDLRNIAKQARGDKDAQKSIVAIQEAVVNPNAGMMYCPVAGKRYSPRIKSCPVHQVELMPVE